MRRRVLASVGGKPLPYDAEVEWLESTGTQYFDTGYTPSINNIQSWGLLQTNTDVPFGCLNFIIVSGYHRFFTTSGVHYGQHQDTFHVWELNASLKTLLIDGTRNASNIGTTDAVGNLWLFGRSDSGVKGNVRLYFFKEEDQIGNPIVDFIFVRVGPRENPVGYMYDRANPTGGPLGNGLYPNAGTGAFIIGPDKT